MSIIHERSLYKGPKIVVSARGKYIDDNTNECFYTICGHIEPWPERDVYLAAEHSVTGITTPVIIYRDVSDLDFRYGMYIGNDYRGIPQIRRSAYSSLNGDRRSSILAEKKARLLGSVICRITGQEEEIWIDGYKELARKGIHGSVLEQLEREILRFMQGGNIEEWWTLTTVKQLDIVNS